MKNGKSNFGFLYIFNMANFEAFCWYFSSSTNPEIERSVIPAVQHYLLLLSLSGPLSLTPPCFFHITWQSIVNDLVNKRGSLDMLPQLAQEKMTLQLASTASATIQPALLLLCIVVVFTRTIINIE